MFHANSRIPGPSRFPEKVGVGVVLARGPGSGWAGFPWESVCVCLCVHVFSACGDTAPHLAWAPLLAQPPQPQTTWVASHGEEKLGPQSQGKLWSMAGHRDGNLAFPGVCFPRSPGKAWPRTLGGVRTSELPPAQARESRTRCWRCVLWLGVLGPVT